MPPPPARCENAAKRTPHFVPLLKTNQTQNTKTKRAGERATVYRSFQVTRAPRRDDGVSGRNGVTAICQRSGVSTRDNCVVLTQFQGEPHCDCSVSAFLTACAINCNQTQQRNCPYSKLRYIPPVKLQPLPILPNSKHTRRQDSAFYLTTRGIHIDSMYKYMYCIYA